MSKLNVNAISPQSGSTIRLTSNLNINGHVTASGNISASGTVFADNFQSTGGDSAGISFTDDFVLTGNMTASGDISGSATSTGSFGSLVVSDKVQGDLIVSSSTNGSILKVKTTTTNADAFAQFDTDGITVKVGADGHSGTYREGMISVSGNRMLMFRLGSAGTDKRVMFGASGGIGLGDSYALETATLINHGIKAEGTIYSDANISGSSTSTGSFGRADIRTFKGDVTFESPAGNREDIAKFRVADSDANLILGNDTNNAGRFIPTVRGYQDNAADNGLYLISEIKASADSGTRAAIDINARRVDSSGNITTRPILSVKNLATELMNLDASGNLKVTGNVSGSSTSTGSFGRLMLGGQTIKSTTEGIAVVNDSEAYTLLSGPAAFQVVSEVDNQWFSYFRNTESTAGRNFGLYIRAGSNTSDYGLQIRDKDDSLLTRVDGAGNLLLNVGDVRLTSGNVSGSATSTGSFGKIETAGDLGIGGSLDVKGNVTAQNFIVSSSVTNITYQSLSGSTIFGDTSDDIHRFTGSIRQTSTSTGSFGTIRTGTTIGSLSSGISFGDGDTGIYEKTDDNIIITAGNSLESLKIAPTAVTWRTDSFNINTSTSTFYGIRMSPGDSANTIYLAGSGAQTIDFSKVGVLKTSTTLNSTGAAFNFQGTMDQIASFSATSQFIKLDPVMSSSNAVATSSYTMLDMAGTIDMTGQTQETIRSLHIHPTKTNIVNYTAIDADGDIITTGNISGSSTSTGSFGVLKLDKFNGGIGASTNTLYGVDAGGSIDDSVITETAIGYQALKDNANAGANTAVGSYALWQYNGSTGRNTAVGLKAGWNLTGGYRGTYIGWEAEAGGANNIGEIVIGYAVTGKGSNTAVIGGGNITDIYMSSDVGAKLHTGDVSGSAISTGSFGVLKLDKFNGGIGHQENVNFGIGAGSTGASAESNIAIGFGAGDFSNAGSSLNIAIGRSAQGHWSDADGDRNIAIGYQAQYDHNGGDDNIAIGYEAMKNGESDNDDNIAIGSHALMEIGAGSSRNVAIGFNSQRSLTDGVGIDNTSLGYAALRSNLSGDYNVAIGSEALDGMKSPDSSNNVAVGYRAGEHIGVSGTTLFRSGSDNVFVGDQVRPLTDDTDNSIIIGANAIGKGSNTAVLGDDNITDIYMSEDVGATLHTGTVSGSSTSTGSFGHLQMNGKNLPPIFATGSSIFLGGEGTGTGDDGSDNNNVGIGDDVLSAIGTGARNVAIGLKAMENRVAASENVAIGYRAGGPGAQKMGQNTLVGVDAGYSLDGSGGTYNATSNTFIGHQSGDGATAGLKNTAVGDNSARSLVAGSSNVFLGYFSGKDGNTEGGTYIGEGTAATDGASNEVVLGKGAVGKGSNTVVLGGDHITDIYMSEDVSATLHTGTVSGSAASTGSFGVYGNHFIPSVDNTHSLGTATHRWSDVFTTDLQLSNEGKPEGNEVDGTTGSWTIQEGEDDLYLLNRKNGKKYKFKLEEIG